MTKSSSIVKLNIGGRLFTTSKNTLKSQEGGFFSRIMDDELDEFGALFVDRDPRNFYIILNYMRGQEIFFDLLSESQIRELVSDCTFYGIRGLIHLMEEKGLIEMGGRGKMKKFVFSSDRDSNGILYWLGIDKGRSKIWLNPAYRGFVDVSSSSVMYRDPRSIVSRTFEEGSTKYGSESFLQLTFKDIQIRPNQLSFIVPKLAPSDPGISRNWVFEGSNDGHTWHTIFVMDTRKTLTESKPKRSWPIECNQFFRIFRLYHHSKDWTLRRLLFANIEIYGQVLNI